MHRIALLGAGAIAWDAYLDDLAKRPDIEIAAVVARTSRTIDRVLSKYRVARAFAGVEELLTFGEFDEALVLTPPDVHRMQVIPLLEAGHDVLCEKPLAMDLQEIREIEMIEKKTGRTLVVGFNRRYCPAYTRARRAFSDRRIEVCVVEKSKESNQKRALFNDAIHVVDVLRWFCGGEVEDVQARAIADSADSETNVTASVRFSTGALGVFVMSRTAGQWLERLEAHGDRQTAHVNYPETSTVVAEGLSTTWQATPSGWGVVSTAARLGFSSMIDHFFACVAGKEKPRTSVQEARKTHELVELIYGAAGLPVSQRR